MNMKAIIKSILATIVVVLIVLLVGYTSVLYPKWVLISSVSLWIGILIKMFYEMFKPKKNE